MEDQNFEVPKSFFLMGNGRNHLAIIQFLSPTFFTEKKPQEVHLENSCQSG